LFIDDDNEENTDDNIINELIIVDDVTQRRRNIVDNVNPHRNSNKNFDRTLFFVHNNNSCSGCEEIIVSRPRRRSDCRDCRRRVYLGDGCFRRCLLRWCPFAPVSTTKHTLRVVCVDLFVERNMQDALRRWMTRFNCRPSHQNHQRVLTIARTFHPFFKFKTAKHIHQT
jgi:hypothetical protein